MAPDQKGTQTWLNVALAQKLAFSASSAVVAETSTYPIGGWPIAISLSFNQDHNMRSSSEDDFFEKVESGA